MEEIAVSDGIATSTISLRDDDSLTAAFASSGHLVLDISGLSHSTWASILRATRGRLRTLDAVYIEPESYRAHPSPVSPTVFDLSQSYQGLSPLPGFARLHPPADDEKTLLVTLLGFEGNRPTHLATQLEVEPRVVPVIGVPDSAPNTRPLRSPVTGTF